MNFKKLKMYENTNRWNWNFNSLLKLNRTILGLILKFIGL